MKIHFIQQDSWVEPGEYLAWAERQGHETSFTRCWLYESVPETTDADMLVVLGGYQCPATTRSECDYFDAEAEKALIRSCVEGGRMVIGVCLGAQLVGEALGATYSHSPEREIGPVEARLTGAGKADPFFAAFPHTFMAGEWHNDMPGLTQGSAIIAVSDGCPRQIVRYGKYVYGFQTHMEFTHEIMEAGIRDAGGSLKASGRFIQTKEQLLAFDYSEMNALLSSFLDAMVEAYCRDERPIRVRPYAPGDLDDLIRIWNEVVEEGVAFPQEECLDRESGAAFFAEQSYVGVAEIDGRILGLYILHPNNVGRCGHLCNASYAVSADARGRHIGEKLVLDCLERGRALGFRILQFNAVVESNIHARHLYERLGFKPLGTIPGGFRMKDGHYENICPYYHEL